MPPAPDRSDESQLWVRSHRADPDVLPLADRHYSRQKPGTPQFVPPGRCFVLKTPDLGACWVTSWPYAQYVKHRFPGAWVNTFFRREFGPLASDLIREAVALTRGFYGPPPALGLVTFVDPRKIASAHPGYCYLKAGFVKEAEPLKDGKLVFRLYPDAMPAPLVLSELLDAASA